MNKFIKSNVTQSLFLIILLSLLAYTPLIPFLGFYSDDFFFAYVSHFFGFEGIMKSLIVDRPFNGYLLAFNYSFLGDNVFLWHLYAYFIRLAGGFILFFTLLKVWPKNLFAVTLITLLFLLYPGYLQQTLPLGFVNWTITLNLWLLSLAFTVLAIKTKVRFKFFLFTTISLIFQINSFLQLEFFIGMEVLRLLIINYLINNEITFKRFKKTFLYFSPFLLGLLGFFVWRIFVFKATRDVTDINWVIQTYYINPFWILKIPLEIFLSFLNTLVFAYFVPILINLIRLPLASSAISLFAGLLSAVLFYLYLKKNPEFVNGKTRKLGKSFLLIGFISIVASLIPLVLLGRNVRVYLVYDRYTLTSILGVSFFIVGLLLYKFSNPFFRWVLIILISLSVTSHLMNGFWHKELWDKQQNLWWQLYWRAPDIQPNSMLILDFPEVSKDIPFKDIINRLKWYRFYWAEEQIWSSGNLFFNYNNPQSDHFYGDFLADKDIIGKINAGSAETFNNRNIVYTRDFNKSIIINVPSDISCLKVLDGDELIKKDVSQSPPKHIFGNELPHNWCYYYQKASLYKQFKQWDKLSKLKSEIIQKSLKPTDPDEWLVFDSKLR